MKKELEMIKEVAEEEVQLSSSQTIRKMTYKGEVEIEQPMKVSLSAYPPVLFVCVSAVLFVCFCLSVYLFGVFFVCISVHLFVYFSLFIKFVCMFVYISFCLLNLFVCLFIRLFVYLSLPVLFTSLSVH